MSTNKNTITTEKQFVEFLIESFPQHICQADQPGNAKWTIPGLEGESVSIRSIGSPNRTRSWFDNTPTKYGWRLDLPWKVWKVKFGHRHHSSGQRTDEGCIKFFATSTDPKAFISKFTSEYLPTVVAGANALVQRKSAVEQVIDLINQYDFAKIAHHITLPSHPIENFTAQTSVEVYIAVDTLSVKSQQIIEHFNAANSYVSKGSGIQFHSDPDNPAHNRKHICVSWRPLGDVITTSAVHDKVFVSTDRRSIDVIVTKLQSFQYVVYEIRDLINSVKRTEQL